jgi:hypothetical protein
MEMIIKINEEESYNIIVPDELDKEKFFKVLERLNLLSRYLGKYDAGSLVKNNLAGAGTHTKRTYITKNSGQLKLVKPILQSNRELVVKLIKAYYFGEGEDFMNIVRDNKLDGWITIRDNFFQKLKTILAYHPGITPHELGIKRFPKRGENARIVKL